MKIRKIYTSNHSRILKIDKRGLSKFVRALDGNLPPHLRAPEGDISVAFFDDNGLRAIHKKFLNDPGKTDVITFSGDEDLAGEICVSAERALDWSKKFGNTPDRELALYVAHGYLHLAGLDDIAESDAAKMRLAESEALKIFDANFDAPFFKFSPSTFNNDKKC